MTRFCPRAGAIRSTLAAGVVVLGAPMIVGLAAPTGMSSAAVAVIQQAAETNASVSTTSVKLAAFQSPATQGQIRLAAAATTAGRTCRSLTVSETESGAPVRAYAGDVCLSASGAWSLERLIPASSIAKGVVVGGSKGVFPNLVKPGAGALAERAARPAFRSPAPQPVQTAAAAPPPPAPPLEPAPVTASETPAVASASPAASSPTPAGPISSEQAQISAQLQAVPLLYNKPVTLSVDADTLITLVAEVKGAGSGKDALGGLPGQQIEKLALLSPLVTAHLSGDAEAVQITPRMAETQPVTPLNNVQWLWSVRAKRPGQTTLTLEVTASVTMDGKPSLVQVHTYTDSFSVKIGWLSWAKYEIGQIDPVWKWLGLGTPVAILVGLWTFLRKKRAAP